MELGSRYGAPGRQQLEWMIISSSSVVLLVMRVENTFANWLCSTLDACMKIMSMVLPPSLLHFSTCSCVSICGFSMSHCSGQCKHTLCMPLKFAFTPLTQLDLMFVSISISSLFILSLLRYSCIWNVPYLMVLAFVPFERSALTESLSVDQKPHFLHVS